MAPSDYGTGAVHYNFANGYYRGDPTGLFGSTAEEDALVATGIVEGKKTLTIDFAGTVFLHLLTQGQFADYLPFEKGYAKYQPLIAALETYLLDTSNGIQQVLVAGHSLGAALFSYSSETCRLHFPAPGLT